MKFEPKPVRKSINSKINTSSCVDLAIYTCSKIKYPDTTELEAEIDRLVYELYGLSEEEIGVVEGGK